MLRIPTYDDVLTAASRVKGYAHQTPVLQSTTLDNQWNARFFFKCENFQRVGAFKFRGAFNALSAFSDEQRKGGVITYSSGNHAQAIALAARLLGMPAVVFMPTDSPSAKLAATRGYGAEVVLFDRYREDREALALTLSEKRHMTVIPPYDHPDIVAGQGTAVKELLEEVGAVDMLFVPIGGGGLLAGSALSARALAADCQIYGVEPEAGNDGQRSLQEGRIVHIDTPQTIADGAQTQHLGECTFPIIQREVREILTASDSQLIDAMRFFAERMKIVVEPTGCLSLAGARKVGDTLSGARVGIIISGGNVDLSRYASFLSQN
jgi:threonine dehydratase